MMAKGTNVDVYDAVTGAVTGAVYDAVRGTVDEDSPHPCLEDFLFEAGGWKSDD